MGEEKLYSEYLTELRGLEEFRSRYHGRYPTTPLEPEEPGVRRILEAIAYFSTRTRLAAEEGMHADSRRLFESYFETLLHPLPARAMAQAVVVPERLSDPRVIGKGTEVQVIAAGGIAATFHSQGEVNVLPIWLDRTRVFLRPEGGYRLVLRFQSRFARQESLGTISLHVRYLDDYLSSLSILHGLRANAFRTLVAYDTNADEKTRGENCHVTFGPLGGDERERRNIPSLEELRAFFQLPESELFLHVSAPDRREANGWTSFSLCFDLLQSWPDATRMSPELFQLFAVPIENRHRELAQPITSDGTQTRYPVLHPDPRSHFRLHSIQTVQEVGATGRTPLRRPVLPEPEPQPSWDVELPTGGVDSDTPAALVVHQPAAFANPRTLTVDAWWHQPWFQSHAIGRLDVSLSGQHFEGLRYRLLGPVSPWRESPLKDAVSVLTDLLALKMRSALSLDEVRLLLRILCPSADSPYARLPSRIVALSSRSIPAGTRDDAGVRRRYSLTLDRFEREEEGLMWSFLSHLRDLLDAWSAEGPVELEVTVPGSTPSARFLEEFTA